MITKIIWQTHEKPYEELESFQKNVINTWKNLNPTWSHIYLNAEERHKYVKSYNEKLYESYILCDGINQADIWRLIMTYTYGGVYADMDSVCTMPLDEVINENYNDEDMICSSPGFQADNEWINNSNFAAVRNSTILKLIIDKVILECEDITESENFDLFNNDGLIVWLKFCNTTLENKDSICFQDNYFSHSKDYKEAFDIGGCFVMYNKEEVTYEELSKLNNWIIY